MRNRGFAVLAVTALAAAVLASCSTEGDGGNGSSASMGVKKVEITVASGTVSGPSEVEVKQGTRVELHVTADVADEVHVHGYDIHGDVAPGEPATVVIEADATGVFEVELENAGLLLTRLSVTP